MNNNVQCSKFKINQIIHLTCKSYRTKVFESISAPVVKSASTQWQTRATRQKRSIWQLKLVFPNSVSIVCLNVSSTQIHTRIIYSDFICLWCWCVNDRAYASAHIFAFVLPHILPSDGILLLSKLPPEHTCSRSLR